MKARNTLKVLAVAGVAAATVAVTFDASAQQSPRVRWKMQSAFGSNLPHLGPPGQQFEKDILELSDGRFEVKFHEPGALVPTLECFDAAAKGSVEACWTTPGFHAGKYPALAFFTTVPFGPQIGEFMAWKYYGNGNKLEQEIYAKHGLMSYDAYAIGPETSGWFRSEIKSVDQLKGLKMRFFGLGAKVMQKLGVSTQLLAPADIFPALERGVIDATEFSMPAMDIKQGFHQVAKFNYFPGWHQQVSVNHILINKKSFDALPKSYQKMIQVTSGYWVMRNYAESESTNFGAMQEMVEKYGVQIKRWPDDTIALFEKTWLEVIQEESAKDPLFKRVADDYLAFRKQYKVWGDAQAMKPSYIGK